MYQKDGVVIPLIRSKGKNPCLVLSVYPDKYAGRNPFNQVQR